MGPEGLQAAAHACKRVQPPLQSLAAGQPPDRAVMAGPRILCEVGPMKLLSLAALALVAGCGSKSMNVVGGGGGAPGGGGPGTCRANTPAGASVSWAEDGAPKCAVTVVAQRATQGTTSELLQLQGATLDGASVAFAVTAYGLALEGTHACSVAGSDGGLIGTPGTVYVDFVHSGMKQACSITITNGGAVGGANATGMFSATFTGSGGAVVTSGVFDTPVKAPPS